MRWEQLLFLHWAWDPAEIQKTLPRGLFVDTFDGQAWLGIVPFFMRRVHPRGLPCVPWLSDFLELNVRTYVYNSAGRPGIWFYSLVCNQPLAVELAKRCFHFNYVHARMHAQVDQSATVYLPGETTSNARGTVSLQGDIRSEDRNSTRFARVLFGRALFSLLRGSRGTASITGKFIIFLTGSVLPWSKNGVSILRWPTDSPLPSAADHVMAAEDLEVEAWPIIPDPDFSPSIGCHRESFA